MADETQTVAQATEEQTIDSSTISTLKLSEELSLSKDFDLTSALNGNLVGFTLTDDDGNETRYTGTLKKSVTSDEFAQYGAVYAVRDGNVELLFDRQGKCVSPEYANKEVYLKNVEATLPTFETNKIKTRSGGETATINAIRPIDEFAIAIIQPLLQHMSNPQDLGAADILKWSSVAYKWATGMFSIASTYRTANDSEVSTNSDSVKTSIDNVVKALNAVTTTINAKDTVKVDNVDGDKLDVNATGGTGYDSLNDVGENVSELPAFNGTALGRATVENIAKAVVATDTFKNAVAAIVDEKLQAFATLNSLKTS